MALSVNDIVHAVPNEQLSLFADDTSLFLSAIDTAEINASCSNCLKHRTTGTQQIDYV